MRFLAVLSALVTVACGASSPASPTTPPNAQAEAVTLTVHVTATNGGQPLQGVSGSVGPFTTITDAAGGLTYQTAAQLNVALALTGSSIIPRSIVVAAGTSREVAVDAISTVGFDLNFYRQLVRNAFEAPNTLQPLRRLTQAPRVYLKTVDEAGASIDRRTLDATERAIVETAALWTGNQFGVAAVERGRDSRADQAGWLTVRWSPQAVPGACGSASVGLSGGVINLNYKNGGSCRCEGVAEIRPRTVRHELGHAFGFWHTDSTSDLMSGIGVAGCDALPSARERAAAAIAYQRPVGNSDPDNDPASAMTLAPMTAR
jgi:reprolysin-like metallo-peptidase family M12B